MQDLQIVLFCVFLCGSLFVLQISGWVRVGVTGEGYIVCG